MSCSHRHHSGHLVPEHGQEQQGAHVPHLDTPTRLSVGACLKQHYGRVRGLGQAKCSPQVSYAMSAGHSGPEWANILHSDWFVHLNCIPDAIRRSLIPYMCRADLDSQCAAGTAFGEWNLLSAVECCTSIGCTTPLYLVRTEHIALHCRQHAGCRQRVPKVSPAVIRVTLPFSTVQSHSCC